MSTYLQYIWPVNDTQAVCNTQDVGGAGDLTLNGTYYNSTTNIVDFFDNGFVRQVTLTSINDLSGSTFTINGIQNGLVVNETITGPNGTTVGSTNYYDFIVAVSVNGAVSGVSV